MDTICAIATARATAAISVIRVSGDSAIDICGKILIMKHGVLSDTPDGRMRMARVNDGQRDIDEVLCVVYRAPHSYTGENTVEINCHGGISVTDRIMRLLISSGARSALGGEFTKRAFLNGKMDLIQAEAVCDLINSSSALDAGLALGRMSGKLSKDFTEIFNMLTDLNTDILAYIDFPEEGLSDVSDDTVTRKLSEIRDRLYALKKSYDIGSVIKDGIKTVILGAPNVGKSTLLNSVLGYDRAIVSDTAGTTRDMVSERAVFGNITLDLCDTAGIRENAEAIEKLGIEIAAKSLDDAKLVFAVFDGSRPLDQNDRRIISLCDGKTVIAVINKSDMPIKTDDNYIKSVFEHTVYLSAKAGDGIDRLKDTVEMIYKADMIQAESNSVITNLRHFERTVKALEYVESALETVQSGFTPDVASVDITEAASEIGQITGLSVTDKIIDDIFSKFCVGK